MNVTEESKVQVAPSVVDVSLIAPMDRRADVDLKQARIAAFLQEVGSDALLVIQPENFAWLTGGVIQISHIATLSPAQSSALSTQDFLLAVVRFRRAYF